MIDLKILAIHDLLPITAVEYAAGVAPLSILITGANLDQTSALYINDIQVEEFMVLSQNRILAQVPTNLRTSVLTKVVALAETLSVNRKSILHFEVGHSVEDLSGIERLVQLFCKILLQTPGTDRFRPTYGGGLLTIIGRSVSRNDIKALQASVVGSIGRTKDQILTLQGGNSRVPADERLLSANADAVGYDAATTTLSARVSLAAVSGRLAVANLTF
jgi:hypothetical protein